MKLVLTKRICQTSVAVIAKSSPASMLNNAQNCAKTTRNGKWSSERLSFFLTNYLSCFFLNTTAWINPEAWRSFCDSSVIFCDILWSFLGPVIAQHDGTTWFTQLKQSKSGTKSTVAGLAPKSTRFEHNPTFLVYSGAADKYTTTTISSGSSGKGSAWGTHQTSSGNCPALVCT